MTFAWAEDNTAHYLVGVRAKV